MTTFREVKAAAHAAGIDREWLEEVLTEVGNKLAWGMYNKEDFPERMRRETIAATVAAWLVEYLDR